MRRNVLIISLELEGLSTTMCNTIKVDKTPMLVCILTSGTLGLEYVLTLHLLECRRAWLGRSTLLLHWP